MTDKVRQMIVIEVWSGDHSNKATEVVISSDHYKELKQGTESAFPSLISNYKRQYNKNHGKSIDIGYIPPLSVNFRFKRSFYTNPGASQQKKDTAKIREAEEEILTKERLAKEAARGLELTDPDNYFEEYISINLNNISDEDCDEYIFENYHPRVAHRKMTKMT